MKITKVYTRTGDKGTTSLIGGVSISKSSLRLEAYGTIDELSSQLGLLATILGDGEDYQNILRIQNTLFNVGAHLATDQNQTALSPMAQLPKGETEFLEQQIDAINEMLGDLMGFVLPGGAQEAAQAHICRTVCRRAERCIVALAETTTIAADIIRYVNRLSDYLFILARKVNFSKGISENLWKNVCR